MKSCYFPGFGRSSFFIGKNCTTERSSHAFAGKCFQVPNGFKGLKKKAMEKLSGSDSFTVEEIEVFKVELIKEKDEIL